MIAAGETEHRIATADGISLRALVSKPTTPPAGVLVLVHGLTTNCNEHGSFPALRDRALNAGLAVVRYDARGHGASGGTNEGLRLAGARADADAAAELVSAEFGTDLPVVPLGVSYGGAGAIHLAATCMSCAGLVLWYAIVDYEWNYGDDSTVRLTRMMHEARSASDPSWSAWPLADTGYHIPKGLVAELASDKTPETLAALDMPVLAYYGSRDWFVDREPFRRIAAERPNVKLRIAYGAGHGFIVWRPWVLRRTVAFALTAVGRQ